MLQYKRRVKAAHNRFVQRVLPKHADVATFLIKEASAYDGPFSFEKCCVTCTVVV